MTDDLISKNDGFVGATFSISNRVRRLVWSVVWLCCARWTPPFVHKWRIFILNLFGADVSYDAYVYSDVKIWAPWNLVIKKQGTLARGVNCYNIACISIGERVIVSQGSHLCTGTHDYRKISFPLQSFPIVIGDLAWICADSFVGPGVIIHEGAILSAAGATFKNLDAWTIYTGNPATVLKQRQKPL